MTRYKTLILDADSTVAGIEGIDWLARRRGDAMERRVAALTDEAMRGDIPLEQVYGARLNAIQPTRQDIDALSRAYVEAIAPGCVELVEAATNAGIRVLLISGGLRPALVPLARAVGVAESNLYAVEIRFQDDGSYAGFDESSPLTTTNGKPVVVERAQLPRPIIAVGDGSTDLAMQPVVDCFVAFTYFVAREAVVRGANAVARNFADVAQLMPLVIPSER
ncbi:MAG TPA: HAD-IB family phosphatase [Gemmatimonadaceae bacterium]|nr:HAD-IB family phosphatase [Gemmatimonadaceae bacterium]